MLERAGLGLTVTFSVFALSNAASACDWRVGGCGPYGYYAAPFVRYYAPPLSITHLWSPGSATTQRLPSMAMRHPWCTAMPTTPPIITAPDRGSARTET